MYTLPDHPIISNMERTGYPDGKEPEHPKCPVCRDDSPETIYKDDRKTILGCDSCLRTEYADNMEVDRCPVCQQECDILYVQNREIIGCDNCVSHTDPWEEDRCFSNR